MSEPRSETDVIEKYKQMRQELGALSDKINELESKVQEHTLVLKTLEPLEEGRKCFRLVGGVLVEQNVGVVRPTVQGNMDNLKLVLQQFTSQLQTKRKAFLDYQNKYKIRVASSPEEAEAMRQQAAQQQQQQQQSGQQQGVLVATS